MDSKTIKFEDYFGIASTTFKSIGLNPYFESKRPTPKRRRWLNTILFQICFWVLTGCTSLEVVFSATVANKEQLIDFCRAYACVMFGVMSIEEMLLIWMEGDKFDEFILQLEDIFPNDLETQEKYDIHKHLRDTKVVLKNLTTVFLTCIFIWVAGGPSYDFAINYINGTRYVFELPFKMWSPFDLTQRIVFEIVLFLECITVYGSVLVILAVNTLFVSIVAQINLQFDMLAQNLRDLEPNDKEGVIRIILMHNRLIVISQKFSQLISRTVFINNITSSMAICCGLFIVVTSSTSDAVRYFMLVLCVLVQTFNLSYIGDSLIQHVS